MATTDWPDNVWADYPFAVVRLTTLECGGAVHLLFGYVELIPDEIPLPTDYRTKRLNLSNKRSVLTSLSVLPSHEAVQWYESALVGQLLVPKNSRKFPVQTVELAPEPRLGRFVAASAPPVVAHWHAGPRIHRLVPMTDLPAPVSRVLQQPNGSDEGTKIREWLEKHCFVDLAACPDCAGGLLLLAPNPILKSCSEYPLGFLDDGREVIGVKAVPRAGRTLTDLSIGLREVRPDGQATVTAIQLDPFGKAQVILPQRASETALEINCSKRGLLSAVTPYPFLRAIQLNIRMVTATTTIEIPGRRKGAPVNRYTVSTSGLSSASPIGPDHSGDALSRLSVLLGMRSGPQKTVSSENLIIGNRPAAVTFIRNLIWGAARQVLFIDPYFSFIDVREFALSVSSQSCVIGVLTGREEPRWKESLGHFTSTLMHGALLKADLEQINRIRTKTGSAELQVKVMGGNVNKYHDRFLVVDDEIWHFGHSFNALGDGSVSMAIKLNKGETILKMLMTDFDAALTFEEYWSQLSAATIFDA